MTVWRWTLLQLEQYSLLHSDSAKMEALANEALLTASQWQCGDGRSYKWNTIHCLTMTVWRCTLLQMEHYSLHHSESAKMDALTNWALFSASKWLCGDGRSYKWSTIHCLTVTVCRWTLLQMKHYSLPHSESAKIEELTNGSLFTASQWQCEDKRSYKWHTIHYSLPKSDSVEMDTLRNGPLFTVWL